MKITREQLRKYQEVVSMWQSRFDTYEVGLRLDLPESLVSRWVANFRDVMMEAA